MICFPAFSDNKLLQGKIQSGSWLFWIDITYFPLLIHWGFSNWSTRGVVFWDFNRLNYCFLSYIIFWISWIFRNTFRIRKHSGNQFEMRKKVYILGQVIILNIILSCKKSWFWLAERNLIKINITRITWWNFAVGDIAWRRVIF